ncbi:hypothetical protein Metev_0639 [Methanohalobium evestigatum Z-7303]|uniref:Uncharacterized protein n=1 Tax=Methanohalobium evestigatum (strain ATCC BAA-1072 / DSM 3721 / NBRC 107634 / OCM 161 / Z-7303) TaxID=644295 RepID=D7E8K3_METEZ|nr:hypothetical protein [Methanohalobium evestigatum]ADI73545.1 hypothetical protein Metev_0639 [Methanohalobium evestigatum Z-7303]
MNSLSSEDREKIEQKAKTLKESIRPHIIELKTDLHELKQKYSIEYSLNDGRYGKQGAEQ